MSPRPSFERKVIVAHADRHAGSPACCATPYGTSVGCWTTSTAALVRLARSTATPAKAFQRLLMDLSAIDLLEDVQVFTRGPLPFMRLVRQSLVERGVPAEKIRYEVSGPDLGPPRSPASRAGRHLLQAALPDSV